VATAQGTLVGLNTNSYCHLELGKMIPFKLTLKRYFMIGLGQTLLVFLILKHKFQKFDIFLIEGGEDLVIGVPSLN